MIQHTEKHIYDFISEIMKNKGFNVYRGIIPSNDFEDRENGKKTNDYFPFVVIRVITFNQVTESIDYYDCDVDFEIWVGTKEDKEENYIKNLEIGDYIRQELLTESSKQGSFIINTNKEFKVTFHSDRNEPYFFSKITFSVYGEPISPRTEY